MDSARILALEIEGYAKIKAVSIRPDGRVVLVSGQNRNGKTSVLNAIWTVFAGAAVAGVKPINDGAETARIRAEIGDEATEYVVTRRFKRDPDNPANPKGWTTDLKVEKPSGGKVASPQDLLNSMLGRVAFDPQKWIDSDDDDKLASLRPIVPEVDFDALKAANKADYEKRTGVNSMAKSLRTQADAITLPPGKVPDPVDVSALTEELAGSAQFNAAIETRRARREETIRQADAIDAEVAVLRDKILAMEEEAAALREKLASAPPLDAPKDILAIRASLTAAQSTNEVAGRAARKAQLAKEAAEQEAMAAALTKALADREATMSQAVAKAVSRVPGLGYAEGRLTLNGQPFDAGSDAERLEASFAVSALLNPTLRVARIRDGSRLDDAALAALEKVAERLDMQVWVEKVTADKTIGFYLEDGELAGPTTAPAPRPEDLADLADEEEIV